MRIVFHIVQFRQVNLSLKHFLIFVSKTEIRKCYAQVLFMVVVMWLVD